MNKKFNGFNNGRDTTDGVGGMPSPFELNESQMPEKCKICGKRYAALCSYYGDIRVENAINDCDYEVE